MNFFRSALFLLLATPHTFLAGSLIALMWPLPLPWRFKVAAGWRWLINIMLRYVQGIEVKVEGLQNVPQQACIVLCKHQSAWETVALQNYFWPCVFVLKRDLFLIPGLGWGLKAIGMIGINRKAGTSALQQVVEQGKQRLKAGINVIVFPEGTRMAPGESVPFQPGGAMLAAKSAYPVVPVAHNAGTVWPRNAFIKRAGTIRLSIGPIIDTVGLKTKEINARAEHWISGEMLRLSPPGTSL